MRSIKLEHISKNTQNNFYLIRPKLAFIFLYPFMRKTLILIILLNQVSLNFIIAQNNRIFDNNQNIWFMYNGDHKFAKKWGLHLDGFIRRANGLGNPQQWLIRPGINFHANNSTSLSVGYVHVQSYPYGNLPAKSAFPENRLWQQIQTKQFTGKIEWVNRLRLEQRFVKSPVLTNKEYAPGPAIYTNRIRISNRASLPLKGKTINDKTFYITAFDEVFVNWGKNIKFNIFDQNRAFVGVGYKIPKIGKIEAGYLNQLILKSSGVNLENNHTLLVTLNTNFDLKKIP